MSFFASSKIQKPHLSLTAAESGRWPLAGPAVALASSAGDGGLVVGQGAQEGGWRERGRGTKYLPRTLATQIPCCQNYP